VRGTTLFILKCVEKVALSTAAPMPRIERISAKNRRTRRVGASSIRLAFVLLYRSSTPSQAGSAARGAPADDGRRHAPGSAVDDRSVRRQCGRWRTGPRPDRSQEECVTNRGCGLKSLLVGGVVFVLAVVAAQPAAAQSTIFNIPTTDTVAPKKGYFEFDYLAQLPKPDSGQFQIFMPRLVVGAGSMAEVGVNFANTTYADDGGTFSQIQPNFKVKFYNNDDAGVAAAAGVIGYFGVNHDQDNFGMVYAEVSKKVKSGNYGPRFHAASTSRCRTATTNRLARSSATSSRSAAR
jgi:hypothetical protein